MAIFRDLDGIFYAIPNEDLTKYKIAPKDLQKKLAEEQVSATQIAPADPAGPETAGAPSPSHITINQFFGPVGRAPRASGDASSVEPHEHFTFPGAWGG